MQARSPARGDASVTLTRSPSSTVPLRWKIFTHSSLVFSICHLAPNETHFCGESWFLPVDLAATYTRRRAHATEILYLVGYVLRRLPCHSAPARQLAHGKSR